LALGTAQRNTAAALVVAGQNFSDAKVVVMITVVMIVSFAILMPLARALAGRQQPGDTKADAAGVRGRLLACRASASIGPCGWPWRRWLGSRQWAQSPRLR